MQKDFHFYLTYALAMKAGVPDEKAEKIAWADQYTDDLTKADLHGIQTQSDVLGNWGEKQIQVTVLAPFHFIPGTDSAHPWKTTVNNFRARHMINQAWKNDDLIQLGIAIHGLQDTFSHQGFSGWREPLNSCYPWYYIESAIPNIGHAEMRVIPDVTNYVWTDPRDGKLIYNWKRAMSAARATFKFLTKFFNPTIDLSILQDLVEKLKPLFKLESYDKRIDEICILSGNSEIHYKEVNKRLKSLHENDFISAAASHLSNAMNLFSKIPQVD